jgi:integrase
MSKGAKGSVSVQEVKGRLRLQWRFEGERYFLSLGYPSEPMYQRVAELKAQEVERDILYDRFDPTLEKYKGTTGEQKEPDRQGVVLADLWEKYVDYKRPQAKPSTVVTTYRQVRRTIAKLPTDDPNEAVAIRDWAIANLTIDAAKRFLTQITACCNWAVESGLLQTNAFSGFAKKIKVPKGKTEAEDIDPFTREERDLIIEAFRNNVQYYSYYTTLVQFLFMTGCRPSEALALQWKHIGKGLATIRFEQALTDTEEGLGIVAGLKTQERRTFPCNEQLQQVLQTQRQLAISNKADSSQDLREDLIFPSPKGGFINFHNFGQRGWAEIQVQCGMEFRKAYQMRHTFITLALAAGLSPQDVAKLVGNSPEMIYKHYAGVSRNLRVPDF